MSLIDKVQATYTEYLQTRATDYGVGVSRFRK